MGMQLAFDGQEAKTVKELQDKVLALQGNLKKLNPHSAVVDWSACWMIDRP